MWTSHSTESFGAYDLIHQSEDTTMFHFRNRYSKNRQHPSVSRKPGRSVRLRLEPLEDRCLLAGSVTITTVQGPDTTSAAVPAATEGALASPSLNATFTDTNAVTPANLAVTVNYGDGTAVSSNQSGANFDPNLLVTQVGGAGGTTYTVTDNHTFPEESGSTVPPFAFTITLTVTEKAAASNTDTNSSATAQVLDAPLSPGDPIAVPVAGAVPTFGGNTGNATTAAQALTNFETSIGGVKNTVAAPQNGGFRVITWDGVKTDGTDAVAGPNSTVPIPAGSTHTVGIPLDRFQGQGVFFGAVYAVSNDGFTDVNSNVNGLFSAFSKPNVFAMFNDNGIDFKFVAPSPANTALVSAVSRGFGSIFLNVQQPGTTITYFHGNTVLDTLNVPVNSTAGAAVFAGELFPSAIVTNVLLTLGHGVIFKFDGTTVTSGGLNTATNNLVAVDDWAFAEPVPTVNGFAIASGPAGTLNAPPVATASIGRPFTGVVATFSDADPNANAKDYTATINWGDGHLTNGTIAADGLGGFSVTGTNTYATAGAFPVSVDVADFGGGPGVGGSSPTQSITNTINVLDANHSFVAALYNDFLGRTASSSELNNWVNALPTLGQAAVANLISRSPEALTHAVDRFYVNFLGRPAVGGEESGWVGLLEKGATEEQILAAILNSQEFAKHANTLIGGSNSDSNFVQALYQLLLSRTAGTAEINAWLGALPTLGRSGVALDFLGSTEFRSDAVTQLYTSTPVVSQFDVTLLDRVTAPTAAEVAFWVNTGQDILSIETLLAATPEYFSNG
jgi:hypothetical protein